MNKFVYLGISILDLSKTVMYEFWYDYVKPNYGKNANLHGWNMQNYIDIWTYMVIWIRGYMDTDSFNVHVKIKDIYKN